MAFFDDSGQPVTVDRRTPLDHLEPEVPQETGPRPDLGLAEIVFRVGASFREGDPRIISAAWQYLLRGDDYSMRRRAAQLGISVAALSKRARLLAESFGIRLDNPHIRELRRRLASEAWARRKRRRADRSQPASTARTNGEPTDQGSPS